MSCPTRIYYPEEGYRGIVTRAGVLAATNQRASNPAATLQMLLVVVVGGKEKAMWTASVSCSQADPRHGQTDRTHNRPLTPVYHPDALLSPSPPSSHLGPAELPHQTRRHMQTTDATGRQRTRTMQRRRLTKRPYQCRADQVLGVTAQARARRKGDPPDSCH